jgi:hypothetical protein
MKIRVALAMSLVWTCSAIALPTDRDDWIVMRTRKIFAALPMQHITQRADVRGAIERCAITDPDNLLNEIQRAALFDAVAEFIWLQSNATAERYIQWRADHGWTFESRQVMLEWNFADEAYCLATGHPMTDNVTAEQIFTALWDRARSAEGGRWQIEGVATDPGAVTVVVKRSDADDRGWPRPENVEQVVAIATGYGNMTGFCRRWWHDDHSLDERTAKGETVLDAGIIWIVQMRNGTRLPIGIRFIFDEPSGAWRIQHAHIIWHSAPLSTWERAGMVIDW